MKTNLKFGFLSFFTGILIYSCGPSDPQTPVITAFSVPASGQEFITQAYDLSKEEPVCTNIAGGPCSNMTALSLDGAIYRSDFNTWSLNGSAQGIDLTINLDEAMPLSLTYSVAAALVDDQPNSPVSISVNGVFLVEKYADTDPNFHPVAWKIPLGLTKKGDNVVSIKLTEGATVQYFINRITLASYDEPQRVVASGGLLESDLYVQYGIANITGATDTSGAPVTNEIWTRAYSLMPPQDDPDDPTKWLPSEDIVPGPTFVFHPNDVMSLDFVNNLNKTKSKWLSEFESNIGQGNPDDIEEHIGHEVNIPHNADNTNLHTHGLHVDPRRDNVVLLIIPEDDTLATYDPMLRSVIPNAPGSQVPGGPPGNGKYWTWNYTYKIPADHMPGTHWYHAHKHGSTSTHVENGMAGTFVIRPMDDNNTFAPGLWNDDPDLSNEKVLVLQEIANYGIQQGKGVGQDVAAKTAKGGTRNPDITVNGMHMPTMQLAKGQIQRWRFVNAGANHRTSAYIWLGKQNGTTPDSVGGQLVRIPTFENAVPDADGNSTPQMYLVALDGVTLNAPQKITATNPLLIAAGNRADVLVRIPEDGNYAIFKNFPQAPDSTKLTNQLENPGGYATPTAPATMNVDSYGLGTTWKNKYQKPWRVTPSSMDTTITLTPILSGTLDESNRNLININLENFGDDQFPGIGWQPATHGGGLIDQQLLFHVNMVAGTVANSTIPTNLSQVDLSPFSPTGSAANLTYINDSGDPEMGQAPSYASPIEDSDINTDPQVMIFDLSSVEFEYKGSNGIKQFWLNGRQFDMNDFVGNTEANDLIQKPVPAEVNIFDQSTQDSVSIGNYKYASATLWDNQIEGLDNKAYWTNPAYYVPVVKSDTGDFYVYDYANQEALPDYDDLTGGIPGSQPTSTTAQEWLLVNNSDIFHPFHIHISPFFVTEIGQLSYNGSSWETRYIYDDPNGSEPARQSWENEVTNSPVDYVVGNWWDVIMIPPHGYVKLKTWINVPWQDMENNIVENANEEGSWVFHCHILRHEDRGMMMVVKTRKK